MTTTHGHVQSDVAEKHDGVNGPSASDEPQAPHQSMWHQHRDLASWGGGYAPAEGASLHPGLFRPYEHRKFANPAPLGLCAFALTTFVLSAINMEARGVTVPSVVVPLAFGYGGLVQLLAGMW